jgi:hypothetical protein
MSLTGLDKPTASTLTGQDKNAATLSGMKKAGVGWDYDQPDITYDMVTDDQGRGVLYDSLGQATTLTGLDKNTA